MAKRGKVLPARRQRERGEPSVLLRSAESLGRVIGLLQRQLDGASARISGERDAAERTVVSNNGHQRGSSPTMRAGAANEARTKTGRDTSASTARASKRASTSATAKKTTGAKREGPKSAASRKRRNE